MQHLNVKTMSWLHLDRFQASDVLQIIDQQQEDLKLNCYR